MNASPPHQDLPSGPAGEDFFERSPELLAVVDMASGRMTALNEPWTRVLGWTREQLLSQPYLDFVHPDDLHATVETDVDGRMSGREVVNFENRWRCADGSFRRLCWSATVEGDRWYCVVRDLGKPATAPEWNRREVELAATLATSIADGLCVIGPTGAVLFANPAALRLLGHRAEQFVGRDAHQLLHRPAAGGSTACEPEACPLAGPTGSRDSAMHDGCFLRADGSEIAVAFSVAPVDLASGAGRVVVFRDVTEQRAAESEREAAAVALRRSEALHRTLTANLPDTTVFLIDHELRVVVADGEAARRLPWFGDDLFRGRRVDELVDVPPDVLDPAIENYRAALGGERRSFEFDSAGLTFSVDAVPVQGDSGVENALVLARDVTGQKLAAVALARRARQQRAVADLGRFALASREVDQLMAEALRVATETLQAGIASVLEFDAARDAFMPVAGVGVVADRAARSEGCAVEPRLARAVVRTQQPVVIDDLLGDPEVEPPGWLLAEGARSTLSVPVLVQDEVYGVLEVHAHRPGAFTSDDVDFLSSVATLVGIAVERHREELATRHAAVHDPLTGLPNRSLARDRLEQALARRRRDGIDVAVLMLDLDHFKTINDSLGHAVGDEVLVELAPRLSSAVRATDTVARLGGDEFVVICPDVGGPAEATRVAERLTAAVGRPMALESGEHFFTASMGLTLASGPGDDADSLLRDADAALYRAKERGRGRHELFDDALRRQVTRRLQTEGELRRALSRGEFVVWYQPVVDLASGRPVSTEALVRWDHPDRGLVGPDEFISVAEDTGLIVELGMHVLEEACRQTARWQRQLGLPLGVSVNVSARQLPDPRFPGEVSSVAARAGLLPGTLALELTETMLMDESDAPAAVMQLLEQGINVVLDDFGTGHSSLSRLKRFPLHALKIDRSFIRGVHANADDQAIVKATIDMAHALELTVVAEGVEEEAHAAVLGGLGCDLAQGYLFARPQPADATDHVLARLATEISRGRPELATEPLGSTAPSPRRPAAPMPTASI